MTLNIGDPAPPFTLPNRYGNPVSLTDFQGQRVILYFYPRDNTPGCTQEACGFRDLYGDFQKKNVVILGISTDNAKSHEKFATKFQLPFPLLCDDGGQVAAAYDSYGLKKFMGKDYVGITRNTFVIAPNGTIEQIYQKVKPQAHPHQVLAEISKSA